MVALAPAESAQVLLSVADSGPPISVVGARLFQRLGIDTTFDDTGTTLDTIIGPMKLEGRQRRLTIYIGESDRHGHTPLATKIVQRARAAGMAGASVFRGVEGYGASNRIHTTRILSLSDDLPMAIVIVDEPDAIAAFIPQLDELISEGLVVVEDIEIVKYVGRGQASQ